MMRESPPEDPSVCPRAERSIPSTRSPRFARWYAAAEPCAPRPTTITSYVGAAITPRRRVSSARRPVRTSARLALLLRLHRGDAVVLLLRALWSSLFCHLSPRGRAAASRKCAVSGSWMSATLVSCRDAVLAEAHRRHRAGQRARPPELDHARGRAPRDRTRRGRGPRGGLLAHHHLPHRDGRVAAYWRPSRRSVRAAASHARRPPVFRGRVGRRLAGAGSRTAHVLSTAAGARGRTHRAERPRHPARRGRRARGHALRRHQRGLRHRRLAGTARRQLARTDRLAPLLRHQRATGGA